MNRVHTITYRTWLTKKADEMYKQGLSPSHHRLVENTTSEFFYVMDNSCKDKFLEISRMPNHAYMLTLGVILTQLLYFKLPKCSRILCKCK